MSFIVYSKFKYTVHTQKTCLMIISIYLIEYKDLEKSQYQRIYLKRENKVY